jgi:hypothetical protein
MGVSFYLALRKFLLWGFFVSIDFLLHIHYFYLNFELFDAGLPDQ